MLETYIATSKINKKQRIENCDTSSRIKRQIITGRKTHTLKMNSLTCRLELRSRKGQPVTSKADRQTSKEHLGKYHGKTRQEQKGTT